MCQLRLARGGGWMGQDTERAGNLVPGVREDGKVEMVLLLSRRWMEQSPNYSAMRSPELADSLWIRVICDRGVQRLTARSSH
jgi:hypothetical protein